MNMYGALGFDTDRRKHKYLAINLFQCHFIHHKSHVKCPGIKLQPAR
jgi:hypothetical protein